jgi:hypothetical protein
MLAQRSELYSTRCYCCAASTQERNATNSVNDSINATVIGNCTITVITCVTLVYQKRLLVTLAKCIYITLLPLCTYLHNSDNSSFHKVPPVLLNSSWQCMT